MKKIGILLLILVMICSAALTISAEDEIFSVGIRGNAYVKTGDTVVYTVEIAVEKENVKLAAVDAYLAYDPSFFEFVDATCKTTLDEWDLSIKKASDGQIEINATTDSDELDAGIAKGTSIVYEITLKIVGTGDATGKLEVTESYGSYLDGNSAKTEQGQNGSLSVGLIKQLSTPEGLTFDQATKIASWSAVTGAQTYEVQLYKDGQKTGEVVSVTDATYDFSSVIEGSMGGLFTFTVKATSSDPAWEASAVSQPCENGVKHQGKLETPSIKITLDKIGGKINFVITDTKNDPNLVSDYTVYIYENGSPAYVGQVPSDTYEQSIPVDGTILVPGKQYLFTVKALANVDENADPETANDDSDESTPTDPVTVDNVESLKVKNPPKLSYTEGETLNLSAMVITVTYGSGATEDVTYTNFSSYGITVDLKNGADVTMGMNGRSLKVTCGSIAATGSLTLTVKSSACQHGSTTKEYEPATCGTDGYDRTVCSLCGVKISEQKLERTGNHAYGEWVVDLEPTEHYNGLRHRDCTTCGHHVTESIPLIGDSSESTDLPDSSDLPETTPDDTDAPPQTEIPDAGKKNPLGGVKDLGRIFLTILIVIVVLIVLFIILAIWLESRRNRRRRSRARTNQARNRNGGNRGNYYR